jgi:hypothetical protein
MSCHCASGSAGAPIARQVLASNRVAKATAYSLNGGHCAVLPSAGSRILISALGSPTCSLDFLIIQANPPDARADSYRMMEQRAQ